MSTLSDAIEKQDTEAARNAIREMLEWEDLHGGDFGYFLIAVASGAFEIAIMLTEVPFRETYFMLDPSLVDFTFAQASSKFPHFTETVHWLHAWLKSTVARSDFSYLLTAI